MVIDHGTTRRMQTMPISKFKATCLAVLEPERIGRRTLRVLASSSNQLWLSPISIWEVGVLADAGQIDLGASPSEWIRRTLDQHPLQDATFTREVAIESRAVQVSHRDPAD